MNELVQTTTSITQTAAVTWPFYLAAFVALWSTWRVITNSNPVHAILSLVISLLAVAAIFFILGAPFAGALEIIVYAGAILVLFVFVVMMLNLGKSTVLQERTWLSSGTWAFPTAMAAILAVSTYFILSQGGEANQAPIGTTVVSAKQVGISLFGPYLLLVELASLLLLGALVAAYHLGKRDDEGKASLAITPAQAAREVDPALTGSTSTPQVVQTHSGEDRP